MISVSINLFRDIFPVSMKTVRIQTAQVVEMIQHPRETWYIVDSVCYWADVFEYYKGLIKFRKAHPALRLSTSEDVKKYVKSIEGLGDNIVGINIKGGQKDESAKEMYLLFNANTDNAKVTIPEGK